MLRKCAAELFGTFALVFAGTGAIVINSVSAGAVSHVGIGLVFGLIVMAMIYAPFLGVALAVPCWLLCRVQNSQAPATEASTFPK